MSQSLAEKPRDACTNTALCAVCNCQCSVNVNVRLNSKHDLLLLMFIHIMIIKISHWVLEIIFHQPYSCKICRFHYDRHPGFLTDVDVTR